ncbi:MAG: metalloregulator ArsR/SmtB family transcription factor [Trueperaceae bacterium]|nr:metalloregulator ArsR/SmtB family transcription factor [Trueperaceae bacterium]
MPSLKAEQNLKARANLFKALGNPTRLLIVNLIRLSPRHTEELASILKLSPGTISHHLSTLSEAALLESKKEQYYVSYSLIPGVLDIKLEEMVSMSQPGLEQSVEKDAFKDKVMRAFFERGRLLQIPTQQKKLHVVLEEIAKAFDPDKSYTEREVNIIIADFHDDFATLRRELINFNYMTRSKDGMSYRLRS